MKRNEDTTPTVNLSPLMALSALTLLGTIAGLVMLWGLHNKVPKQAAAPEAQITADEIGAINLDQNVVRINLMKRNANGKLDKSQEIELPLNEFVNSGFPRLESFMDRMIEEGVIEKK